MTPLNTLRLQKELEKTIFSKNLVYHKTMDSTNTAAKELAKKGAPEGTVILTEEQTGGRGRMGRRWLSPANLNLLFSVLVRPHLKAEDVFSLTMCFALAACEAVEKTCHLPALIKWPNDIYLNQKKLGGILTEFSVVDHETVYIVLGLGLNVNWNPPERETFLYPTTSLKKEKGKSIDRVDLLVNLLKRFELYYRTLLSGSYDGIYHGWNQRAMLVQKKVDIKTDEGRILGTVLRIDRAGALIVEDDNGREVRILNGDVDSH